jgi:hypothetical protein
MITLLYNTTTQTPGQQRLGRYIVDGKTGMFPSDYVELILKDPETPTFDSATHKIEYSNYFADLNNLLWTRNATVVPKTAEDIKLDVINQKEATFQNAISTGYLIPNTQIYLALGEKDRAAWSQLITLINELISLGQMSLTTEVTLTDKDGLPHLFQASEAKTILAGLGMHYYNLWTQRNSV